MPIPISLLMSFGEDERGEVYLLTYSPTGRWIFWSVRGGPKGRAATKPGGS
jgi:hypothetical protein